MNKFCSEVSLSQYSDWSTGQMNQEWGFGCRLGWTLSSSLQSSYRLQGAAIFLSACTGFSFPNIN